MQPPERPAASRSSATRTPGITAPTAFLRPLGFRDIRVLILGARLGLFIVTGAATGAITGRPSVILLALLAIPACLAVVTYPRSQAHRLALLIEALVCALAVAPTGGQASPLLGYLVVPALDAGVSTGEIAVLLTAGTSALGLLSGVVARGRETSAFLGASAQWIVISLSIGLLAARLRRIGLTSAADDEAGFGEAARLLDDLREVARRLPGPLEPVSAASALLDDCLADGALEGGAVLRRTPGARLEPLLMRGWESLPSWLDTRPVPEVAETVDPKPYWVPVDRANPSGPELLVLPLVAGAALVGVVLLGPSDPAGRPSEDALEPLLRRARRYALRLEAALLFDELRTLATTEERRRLAREIHDGIAQELVHVGYAVDALSHQIPAEATVALAEVRALRARLTELISELRLSIFDLRSSVDATAGLGASISEYARAVGGVGGMTVHLRLRESAAGLPPTAAFELLRIAQEAVSNARKHSGASNLWVTLTTSPPYALLRVEDDGSGLDAALGLGPGFGLSVMRERAARLGSDLTLRPRIPNGTTVEVEISQGHRPASAAESPGHLAEHVPNAAGVMDSLP